MSELPVTMDTATGILPAECLCACACACYPSCRPSSLVAESAHARVHWHHIGARTGGGRYATDVAAVFGANPVKIIQPRRRPVDGTTRMEEDDSSSELPPSERCAKFMLDASALATVRAIEPFPAASVRRAFLDASPQNDTIASVVYLSSYGGGICAPDHITIDLALGQDATAALTTQGYSKIYAPQRRGLTIAQHKEAIAAAASQRLFVRIGAGALFLWLPEPTLLHAGAYFRAPTTIELGDASSSVLWMDWLYAGRVARGEVYDFAHFQTQLHVHVTGADAPTPILMETMTLEQEDLGSMLPPAPPPVSGKLPDLSARTPSNLAQRLLPYKTYATVVLLGTRLEPLAAGIHAHVSSMHLGSKSLAPPSVLLSTQWIDVSVNHASGESLRGVVFRMSAVEIEQLHAVMKIYFSCLDDLIQVEPPWHKA